MDQTAPRTIELAARARLERLPLARHHLFAAGFDWKIEAVRDHDALLSASEGLVEFPFGLLLWESAPVLADAIAKLGNLSGRRTLELGAGVGLGGLAARRAGADVVQTDHASEALALCRRNAGLNHIEGMTWKQADWNAWNDLSDYDLIFGSDILYDIAAHAPIARILAANLANGGEAILTDPGRPRTPEFLQGLADDGWRIETETHDVHAILPLKSLDTVTVTVMRITR